jgi:hypothetical protein
MCWDRFPTCQYNIDNILLSSNAIDRIQSFHKIKLSLEFKISQNSMFRSRSLVLIVIIALIPPSVVTQTQQRVTPKVIAGSGTGQCPLQGERRAVIEEISKGVMDTLQLHEHQCGAGMWYRVA